jgi:hypothetical protein
MTNTLFEPSRRVVLAAAAAVGASSALQSVARASSDYFAADAMRPFRIETSENTLVDLRRRIITRLALMIGLVALSEGALAADHASPPCLHRLRPVRIVSPQSGHTQWARPGGVYLMEQNTGLLYGDQEALSRFDPNSDGIDFFVHDGNACSQAPSRTDLLSTSAGWRPIRSNTGQLVFERASVPLHRESYAGKVLVQRGGYPLREALRARAKTSTQPTAAYRADLSESIDDTIVQ